MNSAKKFSPSSLAINEAKVLQVLTASVSASLIAGKPIKLFSNGNPHWTVGKNKCPSKRSKEARIERMKMVRLLRKHQYLDYRAGGLADELDRPRAQRHAYWSAADPECLRAFQRWFVYLGERYLRRLPIAVTALSIVPGGREIAKNELKAEDITAFKAEVLVAFKEAHISQFYGGIDININEDQSGTVPTHWKLQAWVLVPALTKQKLEVLKRKFPRTKNVRAPVMAKPFDGRKRGIAYGFKIDFVRRQRISAKTVVGGDPKRQNTRDRKLCAEEQVELLIVLDEVGFAGRLLITM